MLKKLLYPLVYTRAHFLGKRLAGHIPSESSVLDIGCGNLLISNELVMQKRVKVQGLDIMDMNMTQLPHTVFDGKTIPFQSHSFDVSMLIGVLHHVKNQKRLIEEAKRVTKKTILVFEDTYEGKFEKFWLSCRDIIGHFPGEMNMNMLCNFHTRREWEKIFIDSGLVIDHAHTIINPLKFTSHTLFVLRVL